jgi:hypothetical protein
MDQRHMPCHLTKSYKPHLKPLRRKIMERAKEMHKAVMSQSLDTQTDASSDDSFFMTEVSGQKPDSSPPKTEDAKKSVSKEKKPIKTVKEASKKKLPGKTASNQSSLDSDRESQEAWTKFCRENYDWDAYTLSKVSSHMAKWVVLEKMPEGADRDRLKKLLEAWYGRQDSTDLLLESLGELKKDEPPADAKEKSEKKPKKKWQKQESTYVKF